MVQSLYELMTIPVAASSQIFNFEKEPDFFLNYRQNKSIYQFLPLTSPLSSLILRAFAELFVEL